MNENNITDSNIARSKGLFRRLWTEWLIIALITSALLALLISENLTERGDSLIYDWLVEIAPTEPPKDVIIVAIDEPSLMEYGRWPWPRDKQAKLATALSHSQPKAVIWDILLSDAGDAAGDAQLTAAFSSLNKLYLPQHILSPGENGKSWQFVPPQQSFNSTSSGAAHVAIGPDADGIVREFAPCLDDGNGPVLHISLKMLSDLNPTAAQPYLTENCEARLRFRLSKPGNIPVASFSDVAEGRTPSAFFEDKIVLVGATAFGLGDLHVISGTSGSAISGVELLAGTYSAMQRGNIITSPNRFIKLLIGFVLLFTFLLMVWRMKPGSLLWLGIGLMALALIICLGLFRLNIWWSPMPALIVLAIVYPLWGWRRLAAITADLGRELAVYDSGPQFAPAEPSLLPIDSVAEQSSALHHMLMRQDNLRRYLADLLYGLPDPMFVTDENGYIVETSLEAQNCLGLNPSGQTREEALIYLAHADDLTSVRNFCERPINPESTIRFRSMADNSAYLMRRTALYDSEGDMRAEIHYLTNIGPLEEARRARDEALSLISHDLRAPQAAILASLQKPLNEKNAQFIARQARKTMNLAEQFVDLTRMREREFTGEELLLSELLAEATDDMHPLAEALGTRVRHDIQAFDSFIIAEPDSLLRALQNLIDNALKFSAQGAGKGEVYMSLHSQQRDGIEGYELCLEDNGEGINEEMLPRLFERFARDENTGAEEGFGLGLYYVALVIRRHGGQIHCENRAEGGARFIVWFAAAPPETLLP